MPLYDYKCTGCGRFTELNSSISSRNEQYCDICGMMLKRVISAVNINLKGSDFYKPGFSGKTQNAKST
jgi:putative FmdB family regulatory protein